MGWHDYFFRGSLEPNPRVIEHPKLGTLEFDGENFWTGKVIADGFPLEITLDWEANSFPPEQAEICGWVIDNFTELYLRAQEKLKQTIKLSKIREEVEFTPFEILWIWNDTTVKHFTIRFNDNNDEFKLWRVEFQDSEPINCGYDD